MSETILVCNEAEHGDLVEVLSPCIGRAHMLVSVGHVVVGGQTIAKLWRLNQCYMLRVSDECKGRVVKIKDKNRFIDLAYGEAFLQIDPSIFSGSNDSSKIADTIDTGKVDDSYITSPMDGMFYLSSSPESRAFVKIGDNISNGQILGLIEVMKCFYPLKYQGDKAVTITGINIKNATPVTCGTRIFTIE